MVENPPPSQDRPVSPPPATSDQPLSLASSEGRPRHRRDLIVRVVDGEALVLDRVRGLIHRLNGTASLIWRQCNGDRDVLEISADVAAAFDVDVDTARKDVTAALRRFGDLGLLDDSNGTAGHTGKQTSETG
jgi:hypothetical protein